MILAAAGAAIIGEEAAMDDPSLRAKAAEAGKLENLMARLAEE